MLIPETKQCVNNCTTVKKYYYKYYDDIALRACTKYDNCTDAIAYNGTEMKILNNNM